MKSSVRQGQGRLGVIGVEWVSCALISLLLWPAPQASAQSARQPASAAQTATPLPSTTRKIVLEKADKGHRWKLIEAPVPTLRDDQVLIHVHALALNRSDLDALQRESSADRSGHVPGSDAAGEVIAVGRQVTGIRKGARVTSTYFANWLDGPFTRERLKGSHGWQTDGVFAEYIVLDGATVVPIPDGLSYEEAATLPTAGLTAWNALVGHREIHSGDVVLVQGTGGVSVFAAQFASALGARVILTSSSDEKMKRARAFGVSDGINYKTEPAWSGRVLELTQNHGADVVVDVGGTSTIEQSVKSLADGGTLSIVGGLTGYDGNISSSVLLYKSAHAQGIFVGSRADQLRMNAFITAHKLHPVIDHVFPLGQFDEALKRLASGDFVGKLVLKL